jgi:branched-chain amino acid transport system ATP-binding protein
MDEKPILQVRDLSKRYAGLEAVSGLSFSAEPGAITALIGPNGAGKSTTFNLISGLEQPTSGSVMFRGQNITALSVHVRCPLGIARTFQTPKVFDHLTVRENVMVGLHGRSRSGLLRCGMRLPGFRAEERSIGADAQRWLEFAGLEQLAHRSAGALSFGEQRALEFARAMAAKPELLLLDEPTSGLTPAETEAFAARLMTIVRERVAVVIVEHDLPFISSIAGKVVVLAHGRKIYDGSVAGMRADAGVVEAYVGRPRKLSGDA